jgi:hypothetical protein
MDCQVNTRKQHKHGRDNSKRGQYHSRAQASARFLDASRPRDIPQQNPLDTQSRNEPEHAENMEK